MLRKLKIRTRLALMATVPLVLVGLLAGSTFFLIKNLAINGPAYERIVASKDFVAEIHPPRLYLLQAHMLMQQLARPESEPGARAGLQGEIDQVQIQYENTFDEWENRLKDPKEREYLQQSREASEEYFTLYRESFLKLQADGKDARAAAVLDGPMSIAYLRHQSAIENVVGTTTANVAAAEKHATDTTQKQMALLLVCMIVLGALSAALGFSTVRSITSRIRKLRHVATVELPEVIENVKKSTLAGEEIPTYRPIELGGHDELTDATQAFNAVLGTAVDLAAQQSRLRRSTGELFVNLGRRNHKLLSRTLSYISELERDERDPATLQKLFKLDHLATRMRRHAESLLVLAGSAPLRTWSRPVPVGDVLRAALSEIEAYDRVDVSSLEPMSIKGSVISDLAHLMAELLENATTFSPPHTRIRLLGRTESEGYTLVVVDEGIGMTPQEMALANHHLAIAGADPTRLPGNSRMLGLGVVGRLAARHELEVSLADAPLGGTVARVTLPNELLTPPKVEAPEELGPDATTVLRESASLISLPQSPSPGPASVPAPARPAPSIPVPTSAPKPVSALPSRTILPGAGVPKPVSELAGETLAEEPAASDEGAETVATATVPVAGDAPGFAGEPAAKVADAAAATAVVSNIPLQPRSAERVDAAAATAPHALTPVGAEGNRHSGQSPSAIPLEQVAGHENAYTPHMDEAFSITVGSHTNTTGALPTRRPAHPPVGETPTDAHPTDAHPTDAHPTDAQPTDAHPTDAQPNSDEDGGPTSSEAEGTDAPETIGGLRRRVRGENLPDTGQDAPVEPAFPRDAAGVRAALSSFKAGRDLANRDS